MNNHDIAAMATIQDYRKRHDEYPCFVEATPEHLEKLECTHFECMDLPGPMEFTALDSTGLRTPIVTNIPVVEVGAGDIVYKRLVIQEIGNSQEQANCALNERFHKLGAKLVRARLILLEEPKRMWGLYGFIYPPTYYSQIEMWVFGKKAALEEAIANHSHNEH